MPPCCPTLVGTLEERAWHHLSVDYAEGHAFAQEWAKDWNDHDVEEVLAHFADQVIFTSPVVAKVVEGSNGVIYGKTALREYGTEALRRVPDLHFDVLGVYVGVDTVVLNYRNQKGGLVSEVLVFDGPVVTQGHGTYLESDPTPGERRSG